MVTALALMDRPSWEQQFDQPRIDRLRRLATVPDPVWVPSWRAPGLDDRLRDVEVLLTGWGAPPLDGTALARMPRLRTVLHCAGSVRDLIGPALWEHGITVSTSADLNADPVADFTLGAILMAGKKAPFLAAEARRHRDDWAAYRAGWGARSTTGLTVGLVGFSRIGRRVAGLVTRTLRDVTCLVADPIVGAAEVAAAGARLADLDEMLPRLDVLSIHAPELPSTRHLISAARLARLPDRCCVINTARGSLIDTAALTAECASGRLTAILDVTDPEPLPADSVLYDLPNVMLTPHIAGSLDGEAQRMADGALDELERLAAGRPLLRPVRLADMAHSA
ncbi:MAG TPA: hydroxyacid dehydrogenase [Actinoplanes sp.]|nr:hydroxyacid dehydrogenase [Actinoplanes sp.]